MLKVRTPTQQSPDRHCHRHDQSHRHRRHHHHRDDEMKLWAGGGGGIIGLEPTQAHTSLLTPISD